MCEVRQHCRLASIHSPAARTACNVHSMRCCWRFVCGLSCFHFNRLKSVSVYAFLSISRAMPCQNGQNRFHSEHKTHDNNAVQKETAPRPKPKNEPTVVESSQCIALIKCQPHHTSWRMKKKPTPNNSNKMLFGFLYQHHQKNT